MKPIKCLVIDDEEPARDLLKSYVEKLSFLELVAEFENPLDSLAFIQKNEIDLMFLDIQMPEITGVNLAKSLPKHIKIIFTTAYSEFALEGFELNALDYLLKPITFNRFITAVNKFGIIGSDSSTQNTLTIKSGYDLHKVKYSEIRYIESDSEYVIYHTITKRIMSNQSLKSLEKSLPSKNFLRVHRKYIVNKDFVTGLKSRDLLVGEDSIPVSDSYYDSVKNNLF